jgi:hypothetical protein
MLLDSIEGIVSCHPDKHVGFRRCNPQNILMYLYNAQAMKFSNQPVSARWESGMLGRDCPCV